MVAILDVIFDIRDSNASLMPIPIPTFFNVTCRKGGNRDVVLVVVVGNTWL